MRDMIGALPRGVPIEPQSVRVRVSKGPVSEGCATLRLSQRGARILGPLPLPGRARREPRPADVLCR